MNLAPIILFCYKRLDTLKLTVSALQKNYLANDSNLIIYSDGAKNKNDESAINEIRDYLKSIDGFKSIEIHESEINKGLADSIITGVTEVLKNHERVIVLEDDLVTSPNFLNFMNEALDFYNTNPKIFSISGFSIPIKNNTDKDVYFTQRANSTGWGTWRDRWIKIDWAISDYSEFKKNYRQRLAFNKMGSDLSQMLNKQMHGKINSWAIRWCYHQFKNNLFSVHAIFSKIENVGFGSENATNTKEKFNRFKTILDNEAKTKFSFDNDVKLNANLIKQFVKPFTISSRIKYKLINLFSR